MHDNYTTIDFNHLVKDEEMVAPLSKNIYNQKFCRNFLEKYLDENGGSLTGLSIKQWP